MAIEDCAPCRSAEPSKPNRYLMIIRPSVSACKWPSPSTSKRSTFNSRKLEIAAPVCRLANAESAPCRSASSLNPNKYRIKINPSVSGSTSPSPSISNRKQAIQGVLVSDSASRALNCADTTSIEVLGFVTSDTG